MARRSRSRSRDDDAAAAVELPAALPCPCCGEGRPEGWDGAKDTPYGIWAGVDSAQSMGCGCRTCGLRMIRWIPADWPAEKPKRLRGMAALEWPERWTLREAILAWNRRYYEQGKRRINLE